MGAPKIEDCCRPEGDTFEIWGASVGVGMGGAAVCLADE